MKNKKTTEQHTSRAHDKDLWSLPKEEAVNQLMKEFNMSRERAEAIWHRDRTHIRRDAVERLSEEEFNRLEEELANSPSVLTLSRKDLKKQQTDDANNGSLSAQAEIVRLMETYNLNRQQAENILRRRGAPRVPQHIMERVSREEYDEFLRELAHSDGEVFKLGSSSREDEPDAEE